MRKFARHLPPRPSLQKSPHLLYVWDFFSQEGGLGTPNFFMLKFSLCVFGFALNIAVRKLFKYTSTSLYWTNYRKIRKFINDCSALSDWCCSPLLHFVIQPLRRRSSMLEDTTVYTCRKHSVRNTMLFFLYFQTLVATAPCSMSLLGQKRSKWKIRR